MEKASLTLALQLRNAKEIKEIENHHVVNCTVMIIFNKVHLWILKISGWKHDKKQYSNIVLNYFPARYLLIIKRKYFLYSGETWQSPP